LPSDPAAFEAGASPALLLLEGDAEARLRDLPERSVDCVMTSPPYWGKRRYAGGGLGLEESPEDYVAALSKVTAELHRALAARGSFWLNLGDSYQGKRLLGLPWRVAFHLMDRQGWILRNAVVWHKLKGGPDTAKDRLRNLHEMVFHFVKQPDYHYDVDAIRATPAKARIERDAVVSATGVTGVRYRRQIELSTALSEAEKAAAEAALDQALSQLKAGKLADFRMVLRRQQRATHGDDAALSGRARELAERGFYVLRYHPKGAKPGDVWEVLPEDSQGREGHYAAYPEDLCRIPILASCPEGGVVLDPFCGTGTTLKVARALGRRAIGIDISPDYLSQARLRLGI
jgi:site-specific DNA-methyltransferase (adenine-specific)